MRIEVHDGAGMVGFRTVPELPWPGVSGGPRPSAELCWRIED